MKEMKNWSEADFNKHRNRRFVVFLDTIKYHIDKRRYCVFMDDKLYVHLLINNGLKERGGIWVKKLNTRASLYASAHGFDDHAMLAGLFNKYLNAYFEEHDTAPKDFVYAANKAYMNRTISFISLWLEFVRTLDLIGVKGQVTKLKTEYRSDVGFEL